MRASPRLDGLLRCALRGELAAIDQHASDRAKRMPVLIGVPDAHHAAIVQLDSARALNLQKERVDRIGDERDRLVPHDHIAALDVGARPVRHDAPAVEPTAQALVLELRIERRQIDDQQVVRYAVERNAILLCRSARSHEQRLVIAADETDVAVRCGADPIYAKIIFEIRANRSAVRAVDRRRLRTWRSPDRLRRGPARQSATPNEKRRPRCFDAIVAPVGQRIEARPRIDGLRWRRWTARRELTAVQCQRNNCDFTN